MNRYRFKTKEEFIRDGLWNYQYDTPSNWNSHGHMNDFIGAEIIDENSIKTCLQERSFMLKGWTFNHNSYVKNITCD